MKLFTDSNTNVSRTKAIVLFILLASTVVFLLAFYDHFSLYTVKSNAEAILTYVNNMPFQGAIIFIVFYFFMCALPMPFVSIPTLMAGYLFGNLYGLLIVSFTSALGGTCLFLVSRYIFKHWIQQKFGKHLAPLTPKTESTDFLVALNLRFIPGLPFSIPALVLSLGKMSALKFYLSTQIGLLLTLFVYVNAGRSLSNIHSIQDVFSLELVVAMLLLAIMPLALRILPKYKA